MLLNLKANKTRKCISAPQALFGWNRWVSEKARNPILKALGYTENQIKAFSDKGVF